MRYFICRLFTHTSPDIKKDSRQRMHCAVFQVREVDEENDVVLRSLRVLPLRVDFLLFFYMLNAFKGMI